MDSIKVRDRILSTPINAVNPIGACDLQIAAIALANSLTLVTHNTQEFDQVDELQSEDWEVEA